MSFQEAYHRRDYLIFFSAISAVNSYVSFSIKLNAFQASGAAEKKLKLLRSCIH